MLVAPCAGLIHKSRAKGVGAVACSIALAPLVHGDMQAPAAGASKRLTAGGRPNRAAADGCVLRLWLFFRRAVADEGRADR